MGGRTRRTPAARPLRGARPRPRPTHSLCRWCSRFRGRRRPPLPRGVAASPLPRGRGSPRGAAAPACPAPASLGWRRLASAPPPRSRAGSPRERHQRASARGRRRQGVRGGAGGAGGRASGAGGRAGTRRRCQVRGSTHWPQRAEEQPGPPSRLANRATLAGPPARRLARPTFLPAAPPSRRPELPQHGHAPQAPPPRRCTAVPEAPPRAVTSGPRPRPARRWGPGKVRPGRTGPGHGPGAGGPGGEPQGREALDGAAGTELSRLLQGTRPSLRRRGVAELRKASPSRNLLGRTDPSAPRSSPCFATPGAWG